MKDKATYIFEKIAKTALVRAFNRGTLSLNNVKRISQSLQLKPRTLRKAGRGNEALVQLRTSPKHGVEVAKIHDTTSPMFSRKAFNTKIQVSKKLNKSPHFAKFHRADKKKKITYQQYSVPSEKTFDEHVKLIRSARKDSRKIIGKTVQDLHSSNVAGNKVIDFLSPDIAKNRSTELGKIFSKGSKKKYRARKHMKTLSGQAKHDFFNRPSSEKSTYDK